MSPEPRLDPTLSIKLQVSKHRRTVPFKFSRSEHLLRVQQLADMAASTETLAEQGLILSAILEIIFNISLGKLFNIFPIPEYSNTTYDIENNDEVEELFEDDKSS